MKSKCCKAELKQFTNIRNRYFYECSKCCVGIKLEDAIYEEGTALFVFADKSFYKITFPNQLRGLFSGRDKPIKVILTPIDDPSFPIWASLCRELIEHPKKEPKASLQKVDEVLKFIEDVLDNTIQSTTDTKMLVEGGLDWVALMARKNIDYGSSAYKRPILAPNLPARSAILVRMSDKIQRIISLSQSNQILVSDESFEDTIKDLGVYCLLYLTAPK